MEAREQSLLEIRLEIDQQVATDDEVQVGQRRVLHEVVPAEDAPAAQVASDPKELAVAGEVSIDERRGHLLELLETVQSVPGDGQRILVDVGAIDLDVDRPRPVAESFGEEQGDRVRLLAGGAAGRPHADGPGGGGGLDQSRHDLLTEELPGRPITQEARDVDEDRVEEPLGLLGMPPEVLDVGVGVGDADLRHPGLDATGERGHLVVAEVEMVLGAELLEQPEERRARLALFVARRRRLVRGHRADAPAALPARRASSGAIDARRRT